MKEVIMKLPKNIPKDEKERDHITLYLRKVSEYYEV